jgi:hypothetical protein
MIPNPIPILLGKPRYLLILAAVFHIVFTTTVFVVGSKQLLPTTFDANGTAISVMPDAVGMLEDATSLSEVLTHRGIRSMMTLRFPFHIKFYAFSFALFGPIVGANILAAEPLNAVLYVLLLFLIFTLGEKCSGSLAGLIAASVVGLWPSFLLHTTQLVKDQLFIVEMLFLILCLNNFISRKYSMDRLILQVVIASCLIVLIWKTRSDFAVFLIGSIGVSALLLAFRQIQERQLLVQNSAAIVLLMAITLCTMRFVDVSRTLDHPLHRSQQTLSSVAPPRPPWWHVAARVGRIRERFVQSYPDFSSNLDTDTRIISTWDLAKYLPRATEIGLFAPFPNMWFANGGVVGSMGRKLSGLEMLLLYPLECLAFLAVWRNRRNVLVWLLFLIAMMGIVAMGLVVINVGTLYRLRYLFLILLIILSAIEIARLLPAFTQTKLRSIS